PCFHLAGIRLAELQHGQLLAIERDEDLAIASVLWRLSRNRDSSRLGGAPPPRQGVGGAVRRPRPHRRFAPPPPLSPTQAVGREEIFRTFQTGAPRLLRDLAECSRIAPRRGRPQT